MNIYEAIVHPIAAFEAVVAPIAAFVCCNC